MGALVVVNSLSLHEYIWAWLLFSVSHSVSSLNLRTLSLYSLSLSLFLDSLGRMNEWMVCYVYGWWLVLATYLLLSFSLHGGQEEALKWEEHGQAFFIFHF